MIDVNRLRRWALNLNKFTTGTIEHKCCGDVLRILDAFDAMEQRQWHSLKMHEWSSDEDVYEDDGHSYWAVVSYRENPIGREVARGESLLAALLAAAETLTTKESEHGD